MGAYIFSLFKARLELTVELLDFSLYQFYTLLLETMVYKWARFYLFCHCLLLACMLSNSFRWRFKLRNNELIREVLLLHCCSGGARWDKSMLVQQRLFQVRGGRHWADYGVLRFDLLVWLQFVFFDHLAFEVFRVLGDCVSGGPLLTSQCLKTSSTPTLTDNRPLGLSA